MRPTTRAQDEAHCLSDDNTQQVHAPHACDANAPKQLLSRRSLGVAVASAWATGRQLSAPGQATAAAAPAAAQLRACPPLLSLPLATAFTGAAYDALVALQVMPEADFQRENFLLRQREARYYFNAQANRERLRDQTLLLPQGTGASSGGGAPAPAVPGAEDGGGGGASDGGAGVTDPLIFNFTTYVAWKVVARHVAGAEARTRFCLEAGRQLLAQVWPEGLETAAAAARAGPGGRADEAALVALVEGLLGRLKEGGYCCTTQLVWGELPGGWPQDWMTSQAPRMGLAPLAGSPATPGFNFQVKLHRPADLEGGVALRSEEEGFWQRSVSSMLVHLLRAAGYPAVGPNSVDETFFQDVWQGPERLVDQVLLALGDPLETSAGVDFYPTTLVQNWELTG